MTTWWALSTRVHTTTAYYPQSNGLVERTHQQLKEVLAAQGGDWISNLPWVLFGLMNTLFGLINTYVWIL